MRSDQLCSFWRDALAKWAIPESILETSKQSPWKLSPEKFAPTDARKTSLTVKRISEFLDRNSESRINTILDVGCGAGGLSIYFAKDLQQMIAVDGSEEMLAAYRSNWTEQNLDSDKLKTLAGIWPNVAPLAGQADLVICANVLFNVSNPCEFIKALDHAANRAVFIEVHEMHPHHVVNPVWKHFWGIDRPDSPTAQDLVGIVESLGIAPRSERFFRDPEGPREVDDDLVSSIAQRACINPSDLDRLRNFLMEHPIRRPEYRLIWWRK